MKNWVSMHLVSQPRISTRALYFKPIIAITTLRRAAHGLIKPQRLKRQPGKGNDLQQRAPSAQFVAAVIRARLEETSAAFNGRDSRETEVRTSLTVKQLRETPRASGFLIQYFSLPSLGLSRDGIIRS